MVQAIFNKECTEVISFPAVRNAQEASKDEAGFQTAKQLLQRAEPGDVQPVLVPGVDVASLVVMLMMQVQSSQVCGI